MSRLLFYVAFVLVLLTFSQRSEAVSVARNRVVHAYTEATNRCKLITPDSHPATKEAADSACEEAFKALDEIKANSCHRWRSAECRLLNGATESQCSCAISNCNYSDIKHDDIKTFRQCAMNIQVEEFFSGGLYHSARFQEVVGWTGVPFAASRTVPDSLDMKDSRYYRALQAAAAASSSSLNGVDSQYDTAEAIAAGTLGTMEKKRDTRRFRCPVCNSPYTTVGNVIRHVKKVHPGRDAGQHFSGASSSKNRGGSGIYQCGVCGATYRTESSYNQHIRSHSDDFKCPVCHLKLGTKGNLGRHLYQQHRDIANASETPKTGRKRKITENYCHLCKRHFSSNWNLGRHIEKRHAGDEARLAWGCTDSSENNGLKPGQKRVKTDDFCHLCQRQYASKWNLERHIEMSHPGKEAEALGLKPKTDQSLQKPYDSDHGQF